MSNQTEERLIAVGDIVAAEWDHGIPEWGAVGEVRAVDRKRGEFFVNVDFGVDHRNRSRGTGLYSLDEETGREAGWYSLEQLERRKGFTSKQRSDFLFGKRGTHSICTLNKPWSEENTCMHSAHDDKDEAPQATRRIMMNFWGSACEFDACTEHEEMDGWCVEHIPWSKRPKSAE